MANRVANSLHSREPNGSPPKAVSARNMAASAASAHYHCYHHTSRLQLRLEQQKAARPTGYARNAALASECGNAMRSATQAPSLHAPCRHACLQSSYFAHPTCSEAATAYNASSLHSANGTDVIHAPMHLDAWPGQGRRSTLVLIVVGIDPADLCVSFQRFVHAEAMPMQLDG